MDWEKFALAVIQLLVFMMFTTAVLEVFKGILAWMRGGVKLSEGACRFWNFVIALVFCIAFKYGAMTRILGIDTESLGAFAYAMDYIATASVIYMGADFLFSWFWKIKTKADELKGDKTTKTTQTAETKTVETKSTTV